MKASDKPQLVKKWWTSEKPADVKGADLEKALAAVETALGKESAKDAGSLDTCQAALRDVEGAVDKTIKKELDKKKHKDDISVLEKFYGLIKLEMKRLDEAKANLAARAENDGAGDDGEEEEDEGKLFEPDYLYKMIKLVKSGKELNFGFGLNKETPESSRLLLARKGKPDKLFRALKQCGEFSTRLLMCGRACPDPANGKVLVFRVEEGENEPPQILKAGRRFLRANKNLRFRKLKLVTPGGQTFEDTDPDSEDDAAVVAGPDTVTAFPDRAPLLAELSAIEKDLQDLIAKHKIFE